MIKVILFYINLLHKFKGEMGGFRSRPSFRKDTEDG